MSKLVLSISEAARVAKVSPWVIYHLVKKGAIPARQIHPRCRICIRRSDLDKLIKGEALNV